MIDSFFLLKNDNTRKIVMNLRDVCRGCPLISLTLNEKDYQVSFYNYSNLQQTESLFNSMKSWYPIRFGVWTEFAQFLNAQLL